jgi:hypothetical protein
MTSNYGSKEYSVIEEFAKKLKKNPYYDGKYIIDDINLYEVLKDFHRWCIGDFFDKFFKIKIPNVISEIEKNDYWFESEKGEGEYYDRVKYNLSYVKDGSSRNVTVNRLSDYHYTNESKIPDSSSVTKYIFRAHN